MTVNGKAMAVPRGCGAARKAGGIYMEVRLGEGGRPLEDFLIDPPLKLGDDARQSLGIKPIGVSTLVRDGVTHVVDWVGSEYYPNLADFLEEVRRFGLSRRIPANFPFASLTPASRVYIVHSRGWIGEAETYFRCLTRDAGDRDPYTFPVVKSCPKGRLDHNDPDNPPVMCAQLWWQDMDRGTVVKPEAPLAMLRRVVQRTLPSFSYYALTRPALQDFGYCLAMVASFPLPRLVVVDDPDDPDEVARRVDLARQSGIDTSVEDE